MARHGLCACCCEAFDIDYEVEVNNGQERICNKCFNSMYLCKDCGFMSLEDELGSIAGTEDPCCGKCGGEDCSLIDLN